MLSNHISLSAKASSFDGTPILDIQDLEIDLTKKTSLLGYSGSGKTTLAKILLGIFRGRTDMKKPFGAASFAYVGQHPHGLFDPRLLLRNQIQSLDALKIGESLGLSSEDFHLRPSQLSGGMLQRICLAIALASGKPVILDEPTSSVDPATKALIIAKLEAHVGGFLLITHDPEIAEICDKHIVLNAGRVTDVQDDLQNTTYFRELREAHSKLAEMADRAARPPSEPPKPEVVASLSSVSLAFQKRQVLRCADLEIRDGERVALVGASGSGKSTISRLFGHLLSPDVGNVSGERGIVVFQTSGWNPMTRLRDGFRSVLSSHPGDLQALFQKLGLKGELNEWLDRYPSEVSGGELQRFQLLRKLVLKPRLLIVDEGLSGLDLPRKVEIIELLDSLQRDLGFALLVIDHDPGVAAALGARIVHVSGGTLS